METSALWPSPIKVRLPSKRPLYTRPLVTLAAAFSLPLSSVSLFLSFSFSVFTAGRASPVSHSFRRRSSVLARVDQ